MSSMIAKRKPSKKGTAVITRPSAGAVTRPSAAVSAPVPPSRRPVVAARQLPQQQYVISNTHPLKDLAKVPVEYWHDALDHIYNKVSNDPRASKADVYKMAILLFRLPWPIAQEYIQQMAREDSVPFERFIRQPRVKDAMSTTLRLITRRNNLQRRLRQQTTMAAPTKMSGRRKVVLVESGRVQPIAASRDVSSWIGGRKQKQPLAPSGLAAETDVHRFPSQTLSTLTGGLWLQKFYDGPRRKFVGTAVRPTSKYATSLDVGDGWVKVTYQWYVDTSTQRRPFEVDAVAYVFSDGSKMIETREMYDFIRSGGLVRSHERMRPSTMKYYDVGRRILSDFIDESMVESILAALPSKLFVSTLLKLWYHMEKSPNVFRSDTIKNGRDVLDALKSLPIMSETDELKYRVRFMAMVNDQRLAEGQLPMDDDDDDDDDGGHFASDTILAPGLLEHLRDDLALLCPLYCNKCNSEMYYPYRESVHDKKVVTFCTKACMETYMFGGSEDED